MRKQQLDFENNNKGMTTIEAVVIIPISLTVIMLIIWLSFYYYDRNVISEAAAKAAAYGSEHSEYSNAEIVSMIEDELNEYINEHGILLEDLNSLINVDYGNITVEVSGSISIPSEMLFGNIYSESGWKIKVKQLAPRLRSSSFIRMVNRIKNAAG